ncbi:3-oxoacyl-ACP synthase [Rhodobacter sp. NSM]|uniref:3-oxoacyl-ACP synthase n=1 Tax=Rhodobacter sp. NSM TaxID=3457501 RepID=UPI003FD37201
MDEARGVSPALSVAGYGMWTALGPDGPSTVAGLDARLIVSRSGDLREPLTGEPMPCFRVAAHHWWAGPSFLVEMVMPVLEECYEQLAALPAPLRRRPAEVPVLIAVAPPHRPARPADLEKRLLEDLRRRLGRLPDGSAVVGAGRVGLPHLAAQAARQASRYPVQILLGVESFLLQDIVDHYAGCDRLLSEENSSGFVPGEAAAALVVVPASAARGLSLRGMGAGREPSGAGGTRETPVTGAGLTTAMRAALSAAGVSLFDIPNIFGDVNGEHFKFKEAMIAAMRLDRLPPGNVTRRPRGHPEHWNAVEGLGEIGAALMPAQIGWAFEAARAGRLPQGRALAFAGEDDGARVAVVAAMEDGR